MTEETYTGTDGRTYKWDSTTGKLTISGTGTMSSILQGVLTKSDSNTINLKSDLKTVVIEEGITNLNSSVFEYCTALTSITIPSTVTSIASWSLSNTAITRLDVPSSVTSIGGSVVKFNSAIKTIVINGTPSLADSAFISASSMETIVFAGSQPTLGSASLNFGSSSVTIYTSGWGTTSIFDSTVMGTQTYTLVNAIPYDYKLVRYRDGTRIQVDSAIRDGNGAKIDTSYDKKGKLTIGGTTYDVVVSNTDSGTAGYITFYIPPSS